VLRGLLDCVLAVALGYVLILIGSAAVEVANSRSELRLATAEAQSLYDAFVRYGERNHGYPASYVGEAFDPQTLAPLTARGYYAGALTSHLHEGRIDAYDSPDDRGPNREFWVEMSLRSDPAIRILVARSDDAPLGRGIWRDGVFVFREGRLEAR
jgi:hypothetical protein